MNINTIVINLIAPPGTGKTTMASELFSLMKWEGYDVELVSEYAKELVWEERTETIKNEVYLFGKQHHRIFRLLGKVKYIITDRPLILSNLYNSVYGDNSPEFSNLVLHEVNKMNNYNILLERTKPYVEKGRNQTEEESMEFVDKIIELLDKSKITYKPLLAQKGYSKLILEEIERIYGTKE
jgi:tRNA uridine 5-carbamoylmethylation protein Kti12